MRLIRDLVEYRCETEVKQMFELKGKYAEAKVFTDDIEEAALAQIMNLLNQPFAKDANLRFMPDVHAGKGCTIGTTMRITDMVCPNLVGVDIGCGMFVVELPEPVADMAELDRIIHEYVPAGMSVHEKAVADFDLTQLVCYDRLKSPDYLVNSIGTLGGGNHFIEIDETADGGHYLVIHTGSRNLGKQVCELYMDIAQNKMKFGREELNLACRQLTEDLKKAGREREIAAELKKLKESYHEKYSLQDKDLAVITGQDLEDYLHDMKICQAYAAKNREMIAQTILTHLFGISLKDVTHWQCIHNYIDVDNRILRKGSISAQKGEMVIIPLNMRDGCIIGKGKGNPDWNFSGPHGAGRKMSRAEAKKTLSVDDFRDTMSGIFSTTVGQSTLDEAPGAYKNAEEIVEYVTDSVEVLQVVKPVYNFKAS